MGELADLPRLHIDLMAATEVDPAHARVMFSPIGLLRTSRPARLRRYAHGLLAAADLLELRQAEGAPGQQTLEVAG